MTPARNATLTVALTFDHLGGGVDVGRGVLLGPDRARPDLTVAMPRLLATLADVAAVGTFYIEGWSILHHPDVIDALLAAGHDVGLSGWAHATWADLAEGERRHTLSDGAALLRLAGVERPGFRAPGGYLGPGDLDTLDRLGYVSGSSLTMPPEEASAPAELTTHGAHVNVPFPWAGVDHWLYHLDSDRPATDATWTARWRDLATEARGWTSPLVLCVRPSLTGVDDVKFAVLREFLHELAADPTVEFRSIDSIARAAAADGAESAGPPTDTVAGPASIVWAIDPDRPPPPPSAGRDDDVDAWVTYLRRRALIGTGPHSAEVLSGGVSGRVVAVDDLIVKRAHRRLEVPFDWQCGRSRTIAEAHALRLVGRAHPDLVPDVVHVDEANDVLVQRRATGVPWKSHLLAGIVDSAVGTAIIDALGAIHRVDATELGDGAARFARLRLIPYLRRAGTARPDLAAALAAVDERLRATRSHLVHGDFSPKNILVAPDAAITVLDWEVAHHGDPAFDFAFFAVHLLAKAERDLPNRRWYAGLLDYLVDRWSGDHAWLATLTGAVAVARCWGASRLEYQDDAQRAALSEHGERLLRTGDVATLALPTEWGRVRGTAAGSADVDRA